MLVCGAPVSLAQNSAAAESEGGQKSLPAAGRDFVK